MCSVHVRMHVYLFIYLSGFKRGHVIPIGTPIHIITQNCQILPIFSVFSGISAISWTSRHAEVAGHPLFSEI